MSSVKIFIACHKPYDVPSNDVYTPIHVGKATSTISMNMIGDNTGENISDKNSTYCETTGHYWVWKNVHDVDYVGFCHYRRYFNYTFSKDNIDSLFKDGTDVILPSPNFSFLTMQHTLLLYVCSDDVTILKYVIHKHYPEYESTFDNVLLSVKDYPYNMLVCRKELFDKYATWLFDILFKCEDYIKLSPYSRGARVFGYIAEFLMIVFFTKNKYKIKCIDTVFVPETGKPIINKPRWQDSIKMAAISFWAKHVCKRPHMYDTSHVTALRNDGIPIDFSKK